VRRLITSVAETEIDTFTRHPAWCQTFSKLHQIRWITHSHGSERVL